MNVKQTYYIIGVMLCTILLPALYSCENERTPESVQPERVLAVNMGASRFATRSAGDLPVDFSRYDHATALSPVTQIQGYLTFQDNEDQNKWKYVSTIFGYQADDTWTSRVALKDGQYYLYGYMPKDDVTGNVTLAPIDGSYDKGVVMTFTDLNAVTPHDICIIVGAEGYASDAKPDMSGRMGQFGYHTNDGDRIFLLVDHLYAALQFKMKLGETYSQLRGVKVKSIRLLPDNGDGDVVETVTATVRIVANTSGINPMLRYDGGSGGNISGEVTFASGKTGKSPSPAVLYEGEGKDLTTTPQTFQACLCATMNNRFVLETRYNVYDRRGNLIREDETARNTVTLPMSLTSGYVHTVNVVVQPTYLYMLSEPDLDNPTFVTD